ncbi:MAG: carboxypeptidase-like regulatory domain-containing protein [Bryobacteraceae bacterium]|jgi:hypothetical protein
MSHCRVPSLISVLILATSAMLCAQATPQASLTIQGHVFSSEGSRVSGATVTIEGPSRFVEVTDSGTDPGHFTSPALQTGTYKVTANKEGYRSQPATTVTLDKESLVLDFVLDPACGSCGPGKGRTEQATDFWGTLMVVCLFFASIWLVRWHNIALPNREMLRAEIDQSRARFQSETGDPVATVPWLDTLLTNAADALKWHWWRTACDFLFWSRGQEITGWSRINEFRRGCINLVSAKVSPDTICARLQSVELDLLDIDKTHAKTIAANIKDALEAKPPTPAPALRALLVESLTYLNDENVNTFAQLVGWQTKAVWLAGVGCTLVVVLAFAVGNPVLFIAGAAGGYLSRLARTLKRADVPTDYGASWTTLFLSPIVGALSGWFGILLIVVLADSKLNILGTAFQSVKWCNPLAPIPLGLAFALGFSERLFDGIISSLEDKVDSDRKAATKPQQPTSSVSAASGTPAPQPPVPAANVEPKQQGQDAGAPKVASQEGQAGQPGEAAHETDPNP